MICIQVSEIHKHDKSKNKNKKTSKFKKYFLDPPQKKWIKKK